MLNFFTKRSVGIDIADNTIEVVEILKDRKGESVWSKGRVLLDSGIVERGRIKNKKKLAEALKKVLREAKPHPVITRDAIFGLPESQVYIHSFYITEHKEKERESIILNEALANIPLEKDDLLFSYKIFPSLEKKTEVLLVAVSRETALEWYVFFNELSINVEMFDIESLAVFRGLFPGRSKKPVCVIDIGSATTNVSIFDKNGLWYSYNNNIAGNSLTAEVAKVLDKSESEAEKLKKQIGLSQAGEKIFFILTKILYPMIEDIRITLDYFKEQTGQRVDEVILIGGSSKLKGLLDYMKTNLGMPVKIGKSALFKSDVPLVYIEASGLALRGVEEKWNETDPFIILDEKMKRKEGIISEELEHENKKPDFLKENGKKTQPLSEWKPPGRMKKRLIALFFILIIVSISFASVYFYRQREKIRVEEAVKAKAEAVKMLEKIKSERVKEEEKKKAEIEAAKKVAEEIPKVTVKKTPTGWLNVRKGPGTGYSKISKVYPEKEYELLEERSGWYKIKVNDATEGWITSRYAQKQ